MAYKDQHEPWRPDCPPVWNGLFKGQVVDFSCKPEGSILITENLCAFFTSRNSINKAMKA